MSCSTSGFRLRELFNERFPSLADVDVLMERSVPRPLGKGGEMTRGFAEIVRCKYTHVKVDLELGERMFARLTEEWVDPRDLGVSPDQVLHGELGMWRLKKPASPTPATHMQESWRWRRRGDPDEVTVATFLRTHERLSLAEQKKARSFAYQLEIGDLAAALQERLWKQKAADEETRRKRGQALARMSTL